MDIGEYKLKVIAFFRFGSPSDAQWEEMANAVLYESEEGKTPEIDKHIDPNGIPYERERNGYKRTG